MSQVKLDEFKTFLVNYRNAWNSLDFRELGQYFSEDLQVRWAHPEGGVNDWVYESSLKGWEQAYKQYEGKNVKWYFEDVITEINKVQEGVAVFWVTFEIDGQLTDNRLLFLETFREQQGQWKKVREVVENGFVRPIE
jgi:hypothetical protein